MPDPAWLLPPLVADLIGQLYGREVTGASTQQLNEADFLEFEAKFNQIFVLNAHNCQATDADVEEGVGVELDYFEKLLLKSHDIAVTGRYNSPAATTDNEREEYPLARRYVSHVTENGWAAEAFEVAFLPDSPDDWQKSVDTFTTINKKASGVRSTATEIYQINRLTATHIDELYWGMMRQSKESLDHEHDVLIQLSGLHRNPGNETDELEILFSGCPRHQQRPLKAVWQKTLCTLKLDHVDNDDIDEVIEGNLCQYIDYGQRYNMRLHLRLNESRLWARILRKEERTVSPPISTLVSLRNILDSGAFRVNSLKIGVIKYRLALQLAIGIQQLFMGPWLQKYWNADLVCFVGENGGRTRELARPFVLCKLREPGIQRDNHSEFLLYFAQLLLDIAKGRQSSQQHSPTEIRSSLWDEITNLSGEPLLKSYGDAIKGCLHYQLDYDIEKRSGKDPKSTAQKVIGENIVSYLRTQLNMWQMAQEADLHTLDLPGIDNNEARGLADNDPILPLSGNRGPSKLNTNLADDFVTRQTRPLYEPEFTLFADSDALYETRNEDNAQNPFIKYMRDHISNHVIQCSEPGKDSRLRIAILDTGLRIDESDEILLGGERRIIEQKNFVDPGSVNCHDSNGHGTHIVRILLRFAPRAHLLVGKISEGKSLKQTRLQQLEKALKWAGERADIISLSFGLGELPKQSIQRIITELVRRGKLVFAAASNLGGNRGRAYPASQSGVFCIHAARGDGDKAPGMNPPALEGQDNFTTLGVNIDSVWNQEKLYISGTSFATPVAAATAANALDYIRCVFPGYDKKRDLFFRYGFIRKLFRYMSRNHKIDGYDYIIPWADGLWNGQSTREELCELFDDWAVGA